MATGVTEPAGLARTDFLAAGARFYMTLYDGVTLEWLLYSPDPGFRELGEALVAAGEASFVPTLEERARLRGVMDEEAAYRR
jgi:hypothetical protein